MKIQINSYNYVALIALLWANGLIAQKCHHIIESCDSGVSKLGWLYDPTLKECKKISFMDCKADKSAAFNSYDLCMKGNYYPIIFS